MMQCIYCQCIPAYRWIASLTSCLTMERPYWEYFPLVLNCSYLWGSAIKMAELPFLPGGGGGVVLPYMGYIGSSRGIGYGFWGSRSLNRVSFFTLLLLCSWCGPLIGSLKLCYLILEWENARVIECLFWKPWCICLSINKMICNRRLIALNRMSFFGFGP